MWDGVVGQQAVLGVLERALDRPSHAYLFVGPLGSGVDDVAREFGARLVAASSRVVAPGADESERAAEIERVAGLTRRGIHPDVIEWEPEGSSILTEQSEEILLEAHRSPVESDRKVLVIHDADRFNEKSGNALLKTFEEPPRSVVFVLTTSRPDNVLQTIRSRCQRIDFSSLSDDLLRDALLARGSDAATAALASGLAGGQLQRARLLAGDWKSVRRAFAEAPTRLDGTGAVVWAVIADLEAAIAAATESTERRHATETADHDTELERRGYDGRVAKARRKRLAERHKRELTRLRRDLLLEGITAIESVYRDVLAAPVPPRNTDVPIPDLDAPHCAKALDACGRARSAITTNEKGSVHLVHLLTTLPLHRHPTR